MKKKLTKNLIKMALRMITYLLVGGLLILVIPTLLTRLYTSAQLYRVENAPSARIAIVFGAGLTRSGQPTAVLRDRVETAAELYFAGKVDKLLMSGDNRFEYYNEPGAMRSYAIDLGVPEQAIVTDFAGRRTYDTCYRARHIFGVERAVLVTQGFHLPRALLICNALQLEAYGVVADKHSYSRRLYGFWQFREMPATVVAMWEVWVSHPLPVLGKPEPIYPVGEATDQMDMVQFPHSRNDGS